MVIFPGVGAFEELFGLVRGGFEEKFSKNPNAWRGGDVEAYIRLTNDGNSVD